MLRKFIDDSLIRNAGLGEIQAISLLANSVKSVLFGLGGFLAGLGVFVYAL